MKQKLTNSELILRHQKEVDGDIEPVPIYVDVSLKNLIGYMHICKNCGQHFWVECPCGGSGYTDREINELRKEANA